MNKDGLYIFIHLHKTGGTTLNKHIKKNFKKNEALFIYYDKLRLGVFKNKKPDYKKMAKNAIKKLNKKDRKKIKIISGHFLPYGIHEYFPDKKPRYITIVRDPFSRTQSLYNYFRTLYERENKSGKNKRIYKTFLKFEKNAPTFKEWLQKKYDKPDSGLVPRPMHRYYKDLGYKLSDFYFIGLTKNLKNDLLYIYHLLDITKFFINQNISENYVKKSELKLKKKYNRRYKESIDLYKQAEEINKEFIKNQPVYYTNVRKIVKRKKLLTPFTQIIFDFVESLHMFSAFLRKKSRVYNSFMDYVKGKNK